MTRGRTELPLKDQTRNLNPTPEAIVAMIVWGYEYAAQGGGSMDFWDRLDRNRKATCSSVVECLNKEREQGHKKWPTCDRCEMQYNRKRIKAHTTGDCITVSVSVKMMANILGFAINKPPLDE